MKKIFRILVLALVPVIIVGGVALYKHKTKEEEMPISKDVTSNYKSNKDPDRNPGSLNVDTLQEEDEEPTKPDDFYGDDFDDFDVPTIREDVDPEELAPTIEQFLGEKKSKEAKRFTADFLKLYFTYDGNDMEAYIENSKEFMHESFYRKSLKNVTQPLHYNFSKKMIEIEYRKMVVMGDEQFIMVYRVDGETSDVMGEFYENTRNIYSVHLYLDKEGNFHVMKVDVDKPI